jgi:hypothetical protein
MKVNSPNYWQIRIVKVEIEVEIEYLADL